MNTIKYLVYSGDGNEKLLAWFDEEFEAIAFAKENADEQTRVEKAECDLAEDGFLNEIINSETIWSYLDNNAVEAEDEIPEEEPDEFNTEFPESDINDFNIPDDEDFGDYAWEDDNKLEQGFSMREAVDALEENESEVECKNCFDLFPKEDCIKTEKGYLCKKCNQELHSHQGTNLDLIDKDPFDLDYDDPRDPEEEEEPEIKEEPVDANEVRKYEAGIEETLEEHVNDRPADIESDQVLQGTDNAVVDCDVAKVIAHSEDEKPLNCKMEKPALEEPLAGEEVDVKVNEDLSEEEAKELDKEVETLEEELKVITDFSEYKPWSGAVDTYELIRDAGKLDDLEAYLEDCYPDGINATQINDILWFDADQVLSYLGLGDAEDEEVDECLKEDVYEKPWFMQQGDDGEPEYLGFAKSQNDMLSKMAKDHRSDAIGENTYIDELDIDTYKYMKKEGDLSEDEIKELDNYFCFDKEPAEDLITTEPVEEQLTENTDAPVLGEEPLPELDDKAKDPKVIDELLAELHKIEKEESCKITDQKLIDKIIDDAYVFYMNSVHNANGFKDAQSALATAFNDNSSAIEADLKANGYALPESLQEAKKDDELPVDPEAAKLEVHTMLNDLVADEIEAINGYEEAKKEILDTPIAHKDNILDTIDHVEDEEKEHVDELISATTEIPFDKEEAPAPVVEKPVVEEEPLDQDFPEVEEGLEESAPDTPFDSDVKEGDSILIINMEGEPDYCGRKGKVDHIDSLGQLHGSWGGLAVIPGVDKFDIITDECLKEDAKAPKYKAVVSWEGTFCGEKRVYKNDRFHTYKFDHEPTKQEVEDKFYNDPSIVRLKNWNVKNVRKEVKDFMDEVGAYGNEDGWKDIKLTGYKLIKEELKEDLTKDDEKYLKDLYNSIPEDLKQKLEVEVEYYGDDDFVGDIMFNLGLNKDIIEAARQLGKFLVDNLDKEKYEYSIWNPETYIREQDINDYIDRYFDARNELEDEYEDEDLSDWDYVNFSIYKKATNESLNEAKEPGDKEKSYSDGLKLAKLHNKPVIYGYSNKSYGGKFFALDDPIICNNVSDETKKFKAQYKSCGTVYVAYPGDFEESLKEDFDDEDEVECGWCGEKFPESECRHEKDFGYLCPQCEAELKSRGEQLVFIENEDLEQKHEDEKWAITIDGEQKFVGSESEMKDKMAELEKTDAVVAHKVELVKGANVLVKEE